MLPALLLVAGHALGLSAGGDLLPARVQLVLLPQLGFTELASTFLLSRCWRAHAAALRTGVWQAPEDPMARGWRLQTTAIVLI